MFPDFDSAPPSGGSTARRVVVFDIGKVLLDFDYGKSARAIAARSKATPEQVRKLIDHTPLLFRYETGVIPREQFFEEVRLATGFQGGLTEFETHFSDIFEPIPPIVNLHAQLRRQNVPVYIFSNTNDMAVAHIRRSYPFFSDFDGYVLSFEHGAMKPDARIYEVVENLTGRRGPEIIYLDDRAENVDGGAARGWLAIQHVTTEETLAALRSAGLSV